MIYNANRNRPIAWLLLLTFFIGYVLYMVSYVGNNWYVVPVEPYKYPPDNQSAPIKMGLFWMCVQNDCKYDLRVDYMVMKYLPFKDVQEAYQNHRTVCAAIVTAGMLLACFAMGFYFLFLSAYRLSHFFGFVTGGLQVLSSVVSVVGVGMYGSHFRGSTINHPFGWSLWLMVASIIWLCVNGISVIILTFRIIFDTKGKHTDSSFNKSLLVA